MKITRTKKLISNYEIEILLVIRKFVHDTN